MKLALFLILYLISNNLLFSQNTKKATYSIVTSENEKTKNLPEHLKKTIQDAEDASENLLPILIFNDSISVFKLEENTIIDNDLSVITVCKCKKPVFTLANKNIVLRNNNNSIAVKEDEFIIIDSLQTKWSITAETKKIESFTCYKATQEITIINAAKNIDGSAKISKKIITAWFSPEIPYSFGPSGYGGLPGLILELQDENKLFGLQKLESVSANTQILLPTKGKQISSTEYNSILKAKSTELMKSKEK
jgi:GLPGLI family protein